MNSVEKYLQDKLNEQQFAAAKYYSGHALILAGAGSGKTRTLTYKIANLIYGAGAKPQEILAVTFTNKAANEMKERLQEILHEMSESLSTQDGNSITQSATDSKGSKEFSDLPDFDDLVSGVSSTDITQSGAMTLPHYSWYDYQWIGTFHGIFLKILKQDIESLGKKYTKSFTIYDVSDSGALMKNILKELSMSDRVEYREAARKISNWKNMGRMPDQAGLHCDSQMEEWIFEVYKRYQHGLEEANAMDFDDLLLLTKQLFDAKPTVINKRQSQFKHILVDEAQDTNALQFSLMRQMVGEGSTITFIGDDYQSIYRWRGAQMDNFLNVDKRWNDITIFKLETNYRSKPHIVKAGKAIIEHNKKQYDKELHSHREGNDTIRVFSFSDEVDEATQIIDLITKLKEENKKHWSDFTILYRTNAQSSPFEQILLTDGIPYTVVGAFKFFERAEIKDMISYIKCLMNPRDTIALQRIINVPNRKIGKTTIDQLHETAREHGVSFPDIVFGIDSYAGGLRPAVQTKIKQFANSMQGLIHMLPMVNPGQLLDQIVKGTQYHAYMIKSDGEEKAQERMDNIGQLINIASKYETVGIEGVVQFIEEISLMTNIEEAAGEQPDAVRLMSVHASKGLEFPYVFIVGLEEGIFPLPKAKFDDEELEEERRGMYVAITRAKDHLFLSYASSRQQRGQIKYNPPSRFIEELPPELLKHYDMSSSTTSRHQTTSFDEGDFVKHKLFGDGIILEVRGATCIVKFNNPKFGVRKMEGRFLSAG